MRWAVSPPNKRVYTALGASLLCVALVLSAAAPCSSQDRWNAGPYGQTLLRSFPSAPYPYKSRANGHAYNGKFFDAATHYSDSTIGIFIPAGYRPAACVNFIVHFHGWSNDVAHVLDRYRLREQVQASGVQAILVVPQGPKDAPDSDDGRLQHEPGAFADLLREIAAFLKSQGKVQTTQIGRIIISAHSGGYQGASSVLQLGGPSNRVTDVFLFDAGYGALDGFANWNASDGGHRLVSLFTDDTASGNVELMSLLQERNVPFSVALEPKMRALLSARRSLFVYTPDLPHDETMQGHSAFEWFLKTSALTGASCTG